jgi:hypothetical protein
MDSYRFPAVVNKIALSTKKVKDEGEKESYESPHLTLTLTYTDERAINIAARLAAFQGFEVVLELEGQGRQLNLL